MSSKIIRLQSLADSALAQLRQCADELRTARDDFNALDRHRATLEKRGFKLSAPDQSKHAELTARIAHLSDQHDTVRADHRAKRDLYTRCKEHADG